MVTVSLCMIVKNEEDVIGRCLESVRGMVDEIIVVDTGSGDRTKEIAGQFTDSVYDFEWIEDFSAARNFAFSKASMDYCMWLDADDVILDRDRALFLSLKETLEPDVQVVMMKYNTGFDSEGNVTFSYYRERLLKNHAGHVWLGAVHEVIAPVGKTVHSDFAVTHKKLHPSDPDRNLRIFEKQLANGVTLDPRQRFYYGRELYYHKQYERAIQVFEAFLDEGQGWIENVLDACLHSAYCYYGIGKDELALQSLLRGLCYDLPRAELCCQIGKHFLDRGRYELAIFWYELALTCKRQDSRGGFVQLDSYTYTPCMQLCVCYDRLGDEEKAIAYNERAGHYQPDSEAYRHNLAYYEAKRSGGK